jgi:hypothetical protein
LQIICWLALQNTSRIQHLGAAICTISHLDSYSRSGTSLFSTPEAKVSLLNRKWDHTILFFKVSHGFPTQSKNKSPYNSFYILPLVASLISETAPSSFVFQ